MTKRRVLHARKYQVSVNSHLIAEVCDKMCLTPAQRGVVVSGMNTIRLALSSAISQSEGFGVTLRELAREPREHHAPVALYELLFILDDPEAMTDIHEHGGYFTRRFGPKTQQAVRDFAEAVCAEAERGFFRI